MEQTIRLLENEIAKKKRTLRQLEAAKTEYLDAAIETQTGINRESEDLYPLERQLEQMYSKYPKVEPQKSEDSRKDTTPRTKASPNRLSRYPPLDDDDL